MAIYLLTGVSGQLGGELKEILSPLGEVVGVGREKMDLTQPDRIRSIISEVKPDFIVNCAAYTAVDKAEIETEEAKLANAIAPKIIASEAKRIGAFLLHVSTDYVFDGTKNTPYIEEDSTNPINSYGKTKLAGEIEIERTGANCIILRTAWVYGTCGKGNFVKTMLRLGSQREELRVVADQIGSPTWTKDISDAIASLLSLVDRGKIDKTGTNIYHFSNSGVASWYDFAVAIFEEAKDLGFPLKISTVVPITTPEYPTPARRPHYSVLSTQKISEILGKPPHWRKSLRQMLKQYSCEQL